MTSGPGPAPGSGLKNHSQRQVAGEPGVHAAHKHVVELVPQPQLLSFAPIGQPRHDVVERDVSVVPLRAEVSVSAEVSVLT